MSNQNLLVLLGTVIILFGLIGFLIAKLMSDKAQGKILFIRLWFMLGSLIVSSIVLFEADIKLGVKIILFFIMFIGYIMVALVVNVLSKYAWILTIPIIIFLFVEALRSFAIGGWFVLLLLILIIGLGISQARDKFSQPK